MSQIYEKYSFKCRITPSEGVGKWRELATPSEGVGKCRDLDTPSEGVERAQKKMWQRNGTESWEMLPVWKNEHGRAAGKG